MTAETIVLVYIPATIVLIMFTMGLGLTLEDFKRVAVYPRAVAIGMVGQLVLLPGLAFILAYALALPPEIAAGLILLAACSGGATSNLFTALAGGDTALSVTLTAVSGTVSIISIPLVANLGLTVFAGDNTELSLPVARTMFNIIVVAGIPLAAGMLFKYRKPERAEWLEPKTKVVAVVMLTIMIIGAVALAWERVVGIFQAAAPAAVMLNLGGMTLGYVMARLAKLPPRQVVAIPLEVGVQNAAFAIGIAVGLMESETTAAPAVVYGVLMYLTCFTYVYFARRHLDELAAKGQLEG